MQRRSEPQGGLGETESNDLVYVARGAAERLAPSLDPGLRASVEQKLTRDALAVRPKRIFDPIWLAAFIVSLASCDWTVCRDLKKDRDAAKAGPRETETRLALLLRDDESFASRCRPA